MTTGDTRPTYDVILRSAACVWWGGCS